MTAHTKILLDHQQQIVKKHECYSCGDYFVPGPRFENEITRSEGGEEYTVLICDVCKAKERNELW
jgi:RNase P subunit RPR2